MKAHSAHLFLPPYRMPQPRDQALLDLAKTLIVLTGLLGVAYLHEQVRQFWLVGPLGGLLTALGAAGYVVLLRRYAGRRLTYLSPVALAAIGLLCIPPSLLARLLYTRQVDHPGWMVLYFSTPVLFVWLVAEVYGLYELVSIRPKRSLEILGIAKAASQILAILGLIVYFGLAIGMVETAWLFWLSTALVLLGAGLNFAMWRSSLAQG